MALPPGFLESLRWRNIGPHRGGRVVAVAGDPSDPAVFYFGACNGGVWKTDDAGTYWRNVSDGFFRSAAVGAVSVSASDPQVVWAGMGESCVRNDVSAGDGVYRSLDAGRTWTHLGLEETRHISRLRVHPSDPDVAFVAALGDIFGDSGERGVYRTLDGGRSWKRVLHRSSGAGAADLWLDPSNPRWLYAALWDAQRTPWEMRSGGPDSSLWRSGDGGETWTDITRHPGLPAKALLGRMGVCSAPSNGARVWALIEASDGEGGLYRSDDGGDTWSQICSDKNLIGRPWYYSHIVPDPTDAETVWVPNLSLLRSSDGGLSFHTVPTPHGDNHDLWIDPANPRRMIEGNDGGACVSFNGGASFSTIYNQPTAQFYHLDVDDRFPYRVYATQQDNSAISVPSRSRRGYIAWTDCHPVGFAESGHIAVDPKDNDVVYTGAVGSAAGGGGPLLRYDHRTEQISQVTVWPEYFFGEDMSDQKHRFQWTFPLAFSPHDPEVLYACGERVFRTRDAGLTWDAISPDLTRNDPQKQRASGGPISKDTSGAEVYCTVYAFAESLCEPGVFWAGTDDGRVHLSRDDGSSWKEITPPELPEWTTIATLEPSPFDAATVYLAAHRYRLQDLAPYLLVSRDYGASWQRIHEGIPDGQFARVIRADPVRPGLLYAGTESRVYVSLDDGASWEPLDSDLPVVPIYDLKLKHGDLVAASHGRGFWILDDVTPLREQDPGGEKLVVFTPPLTWRYPTPPGTHRAGAGKTYLNGPALEVQTRPDGTRRNVMLDAGQNPRDGVTVWYWLREGVDPAELELSFLDPQGREVRTFSAKRDAASESGEHEPHPADTAAAGEPLAFDQRSWEVLSHEAGLHGFSWDLRCRGVKALPDPKGRLRSRTGYLVPPGTYTARFRLAGETIERQFEVRRDPRLRFGDADLEAQYALLLEIRDLHNEVQDGIVRVRKVRAQVEPWTRRRDVDAAVREHAKELCDGLREVETVLTEPRSEHPTDRLKLRVGLDGKLEDLPGAIAGADAPPTRAAREVYEKHRATAARAFDTLDELAGDRLLALEARIRDAGVPWIDTAVPPTESRDR